MRRLFRIPGGATQEQRDRLEWSISELNKESRAPKLQFNSVGSEKVLTLEEYRKALAGCRSERTKLIMRVLYSTGIRVAELTGILLSQCTIVLDRAYIVVMGKGHKERTVRLPLPLYDECKAVFKGTKYLFETSTGRQYARQYISSELRKLTKRTTGKALSAHKMRHSFATRQLGKGIPMDAVSRYLGHASVSVTMKFYAHNEMSDAQLFDEDL
jgi:integrase/recombinase XerD